MPTSSSPRSESKTRATTSKRRSRAKTEDDVVEESTQSEEAFGEGVTGDEAEETPRRRRTSGRSRRKVEIEDTDLGSEGSDETPKMSENDSEDGGRRGNDVEGGDDASEDSGEAPKRRRRRRRRRGGGEGARTENSSRGGGRRRGGDGRGGDGRRGDGRRGDGRRDNRRGGPSRRGRQVQSGGEVIEGIFEGVLELHPKGYGFLRDPKKNYAAEDSNPFVSSSVVEKFGLRAGVLLKADVGPGSRNQGPRVREVESIDGVTPDEYKEIKLFDDLTPVNPFEHIRLETGPQPVTMRVMDLLCPIGKGQRALLVAPPRTGKTMLLQDIANSVSENHPEIHLIVLLIDERPEEVTEMRRMVKGQVVASSLDEDVESHVRLSQLIMERARRMAESGKDVFILLDSITRLARAFNKWSNTGRTGSGGLDIRALDIPKKLFGTARRFDEGGSLTVCGTALIETNNRMDEAIFQEFKGTGNMEMVLSRDLADRRIWPSIDVSRSGTRREEKLLEPEMLEGITMLRRSLISLTPVDAMEQMTKTMEKFPSNKIFLEKIRQVL
ncbi:MAG: transcription termination factor Rho [Fuerstiella sp.]|nr:transcription termination factor Rho [Fuerstiella sp.]